MMNSEINRSVVTNNSDIDDEFHDASDSNEWLIGKKIWEDRERIVSISNARTLVNNIENYTHNRQLDISHSENLKNEIQNLGSVLGNISLAIDPSGTLRVLDGQHRILALQILLKSDGSLDYPIHLTTYKVERLDSRETLKLFQSLNNTLNLKENPVQDIVFEIVEKLYQKFKKTDAIVDTDRRKQRPKVDKKRLKESLEIRMGFAELDVDNFKVDDFVELIVKKNNEYGMKTIIELCGNKNKKSQQRYKKAQELGWYLTIKDSKYKDEGGNYQFCDHWILEVIEEYKN